MKGSVSEHIGERWGRLEITGVQWDDRRRRNHVVCRCDCGNTIVNQYIHLKNGKVQSCGCYLDEKNKAGHERMVKREQERRDRYEAMQAEWARKREEIRKAEAIKRQEKHDEYKKFVQDNIRLHYCWQSMIQRCTRQTHHKYHLYGSRGIRVCDEWRHDFRAFVEWSLHNGYADDLFIDRIDDNGNYEPANCRWVTKMVNNNNKRNNCWLKHKVTGEIHTKAEWARIEGIRYKTLCEKLKRRGDRADYERVEYVDALESRK